MVLSRNSQIAIAVAGVIALGLIIYFFGIPQEAGQQAGREQPVAAGSPPARDVPSAPATTPAPSDDRPSAGDSGRAEAGASPAGASEAGTTQPANGQTGAGQTESGQAADAAAEEDEAGGAQQQAAAEAAAPQGIVPSFDIIRVEPNGDAVIAGRAAPNGKVELLRNGEPFAEATTDAAGQFAMTPPPLPPGTYELTLRLTDAEGRTHHSGQAVTVVVAEDGRQQPMVALATPNAPTQVLSRPQTDVAQASSGTGRDAQPGAADSAQPPAAGGADVPAAGTSAAADAPAATEQQNERARVAIDAVDVEGQGRFFVSGRGAPGATVRLYLNESYLAAGTVPDDGRLSFSVERGVAPGDYRVRLDDIDPATGAVLSRAEVPFTMPAAEAEGGAATASPAAPASPDVAGGAAGQGQTTPAEGAPPSGGEGVVVVPEVRTTVVSRGDSLWRISRRIYGHGIRYTVIYDANQDQIRNPDLIYPGQVFVLPNDEKRQ